MAEHTPTTLPPTLAPRWRDYYELTKPRVVLLLAFTALVGAFLASPRLPPLQPLIFGFIGICLAAASAAAVNHVIDQHIDSEMARTRHRPMPTGALGDAQALVFALCLGTLSMMILVFLVNTLTALLTFVSLIGYAIVYTSWLKRATVQNIVIGGAAGAAPPMLGWIAVTNSVEPGALLLFLIIFVWTPPHFWALAIARRDEYAKVGIPMMPVIYGIPMTRLHILLYTILLTAVTLMPWLLLMSGLIYLLSALVLDAIFVGYAWKLYRHPQPNMPMRVFRWSINYLGLLFAALLIDHYWMITF
jgi:protoheme IX farnesyltransferase